MASHVVSFLYPYNNKPGWRYNNKQKKYTTTTTTTLTHVLRHHEVQCRSGTVSVPDSKKRDTIWVRALEHDGRASRSGSHLLFNEDLRVKAFITFDLEKCIVILLPYSSTGSDGAKPCTTLDALL
jgi:hypothetical protein